MVLVFILFLSHSFCQDSPKSKINEAWIKWKQEQYKKGIYAAGQNCDPNIVNTKSYKGPEAGIIDTSFYFLDINSDGIQDALITFRLRLCDGGVALSNCEEKILVLSKKARYIVDEKFIKQIEKKYKGWFLISGASNGKFYGTYNEGGRTAEKIRHFNISYKTKTISFAD